MKSTVSTQKLHHEDVLQQEKLRIKNEEGKKQNELEDRLRTSTTTKEEYEVEIELDLLIFNFEFSLLVSL